MIFMILTVFSLFVLVGASIAGLVMLCLIRRENARQAVATGRLAAQMGTVMRKMAEDSAGRRADTPKTAGDLLAEEMEKIMAYTGDE